MATPRTIMISPAVRGLFHLTKNKTDTTIAAKTASDLLQRNHEQSHIFFNNHMMHNHTVHHILTLYSLGASADSLQRAYDENQYQRTMIPRHQLTTILADKEGFKTHLGNEEYYSDFLEFFQTQMEKTGWQEVLNEYVFKGDDRANDMLQRMFAGYMHPFIHLGFGVEFEQPAIIAEGLAEAAVHDPWIGPLMLPAEKIAADSSTPTKSLTELVKEIEADQAVKNSTDYAVAPHFRAGIMKQGLDLMIKYGSQYKVTESEIEAKLAEIIEVSAYICGASQRPQKEVKIDFFGMHGVNVTILVAAMLNQSWLSVPNKIRLLEWTGRFLLALYASSHTPALHLDEISNYQSSKINPDSEDAWEKIASQAIAAPDDGHVAKMVRALAYGEKVCVPLEAKQQFHIKGNLWKQLGSMTVETTDVPNIDWDPALGWRNMYTISNMKWVRGAGFDEAWDEFGPRKA